MRIEKPPTYNPMDFSEWDDEVMLEFQRLMEANLTELRSSYEQVCGRLNNIIVANGVVLSLLFVAIFESQNMELGYIMLASIIAIVASTVIAIIGGFITMKIGDLYDHKDIDLISNKNSVSGMRKAATDTTIDMILNFEYANNIKSNLITLSGVSFVIGLSLIAYATCCVVIQ